MVCSNNNCTCLYPKYWNGTFCGNFKVYFFISHFLLLYKYFFGKIFYLCLFFKYALKTIFFFIFYWNNIDTYLTYYNSCTTSQLCDPTKLLQCTVTGSLFYNCLCQPYYYWSTSLATCSAQFSYNSACYNSTECRSDLGLSCDTSTFNCSCSSAGMFWNGSICGLLIYFFFCFMFSFKFYST